MSSRYVNTWIYLEKKHAIILIHENIMEFYEKIVKQMHFKQYNQVFIFILRIAVTINNYYNNMFVLGTFVQQIKLYTKLYN